MRKDKLIELLQNIEGNPDILIWNGFVGDWMDIGSIDENDLVKVEFKYWLESVRRERCIDRRDWEYNIPDSEIPELRKIYLSHKWSFNDFVTLQDIKEKRWKKKRIFLINPKGRGISAFDRCGGISY
jgi:hypothetical protein